MVIGGDQGRRFDWVRLMRRSMSSEAMHGEQADQRCHAAQSSERGGSVLQGSRA
jgi:hypothetical protein